MNDVNIKSIEVGKHVYTQLHVIYQSLPTDEQTGFKWDAYILLQKSVNKEKLLMYLSNTLVRQALTSAARNNVIDRTNKCISNDYRGLLLAQYLSNKALICLSKNECIESVRALLEVSNAIQYQFLGLSHNSFINEEDNLIVSQFL